MKILSFVVKACCKCPYCRIREDENKTKDIAICVHKKSRNRKICERWAGEDTDEQGHFIDFPAINILANFCPLSDVEE